MDRVSTALMHWTVILTLAALAALSEEARGQDSLIGYEGLDLELFTPAEVVDAGGAPTLSDSTPKVAGTAAPGISGEASRDDHVHPAEGGGTATPLSNATPKVESGSGAAGAASSASRGDHVHPARTIPKQPLSSFGTVGSAGTCAKANSSRDGLTYGSCGSPRTLSNRDPAAPGTADPGNRTDVSRSDHVHPGGGSATPLSDAAAKNLGVAAAGTSTDASRADHVHSQTSFLGVGIPGPDTVAGAVGVSTLSARADHVHRSQIPALTDHGGQCLKANSGATALEFDSCGGGGAATPLSDQTPQAVALTGAAGSAAQASRGDHVHPEGPIRRELPSPGTGNKGDIPRVNAAGNAYETVDAHVAVLSGLPAITGQANKALIVNAGATGVEWKAVSGGSSGGGGTVWEDYVVLNPKTLIPSNLNNTARTMWTLPITQTQIDAIVAGYNADDVLGLAVRGESWTDAIYSVWWPKWSTGAAGRDWLAGTIFEYKNSNSGSAANSTTSLELGLRYHGGNPPATLVFTFGTPVWARNVRSGNIAISGLKSSGGGGGSAGPSIPAPTAAGASRYLRVNAAGAAYELGGPLDDDITEIEAGVSALQRVTQDLSVASVATPWATSTVQGAGIATGTCSTTDAPSSGYAATKVRPNTGWPANTCVFAQLPKDADVTTYRVVEPQGDSATFFDPGGSWRLKLARPASATRDYWLVNTVSPGDESLTLQHGGTVQRTTYRGRVAAWGGDLPAIPGDTATKQYALETKTDGSGVEWSNDIFSALNTNAQDIGDALERVGHIDMPSDAEASKSALAAGQVWTIGSCKDTAGSRECTAGFAESAHGTQRHLVTHGTGAANATSASFAPVGRLTQHALISGTSYDEFVVIARHVAGNPTRTMIRSCRIPGIQGDWLANAANPVHLISESGNCSLVAPATGNLTVTWAAPLAGQKIAGDTWRLYGVDWR